MPGPKSGVDTGEESDTRSVYRGAVGPLFGHETHEVDLVADLLASRLDQGDPPWRRGARREW